MRIAVLSSIAHATPPRAYGPWEQQASALAEGLVARGHEVTLFGTADSQTSGRLIAVAPAGYEESPDVPAGVYGPLHIASVFERASEFDLISNQFDFLPLVFSRLVDTPMVTTIHGFSSPDILRVFTEYADIAHYVAISDADRSPALRYEATIHHGIDMSGFPMGDGSDDYLLFFGRIHPDKGTAEAIAVARRAGLPLIIAGIVHDEAYFREQVQPHIDGVSVRYLGNVGRDLRPALLGGARAQLHLIDFEEPFGLSVVEGFACGTPVIAHGRGALPELVRPGVNGFLVESPDEAVSAVSAVTGLDRRAIREDAIARFSVDRMVAEYERLYERLVA